MKFRGKIGSAQQLHRLILTLSKLGNSCLVQLTPNQLSFSIAPDGADSSMVVAELREALMFVEWKIESRAEDNRISFFAKLENLTRALKSVESNCANGKSATANVKLSKKDGVPMLSFDIRTTSAVVQHDVPLRLVQSQDEVRAYAEPPINDAAGAVTVLLPYSEIKGLRNVVERMKSISDRLMLSVSGTVSPATAAAASASDASPLIPGAGKLMLQVDRDNQVTIRTTYPRLDLMLHAAPPEDPAPCGGHDAEGQVDARNGGQGEQLVAEATVSIKRLSRVLSALATADCKMHCGVLCVVPGHIVLLKLYLQDTERESVMMFYLPVML